MFTKATLLGFMSGLLMLNVLANETCPRGTYRPVGYAGHCFNHTDCKAEYNRLLLRVGTAEEDSTCGNCIQHHIDRDGLDPYSMMTVCSHCEQFPRIVQDQYENCQAMVPWEMLDESRNELHRSQIMVIGIGCALGLVIFIVIVVVVVKEIRKKMRGKYPTQEVNPEPHHVVPIVDTSL